MSSPDILSASAPVLSQCLSQASFWKPKHLVWSAWVEHGPFAFWLVDAMRPRTIVELGTHNGYSFFALCQAVKTLGLSTACYAVDTWQGDDHAGFYSDEIYGLVSQVRHADYTDIATLIRATFDEALPYFTDDSVDLLHIDGRHGYEDVKHDFETWLPKLSSGAVVLFHDINVRRDGFGVWKLWDELKSRHPSFEFVHGHGLGVLALGEQVPQGLQALFAASSNPDTEAVIRTAYSRLGKAASDAFDASRDIGGLQAQLSEAQAANRSQAEEIKSTLERERRVIEAEVLAMAQKASLSEDRATALEVELAETQTKLDHLHRQLVRQRALSEQQANEKFRFSELIQTRHPLADWMDRWSRAHPRRAQWIWRAMRVGHMVLTLQFGRLTRAALRRIK